MKRETEMFIDMFIHFVVKRFFTHLVTNIPNELI